MLWTLSPLPSSLNISKYSVFVDVTCAFIGSLPVQSPITNIVSSSSDKSSISSHRAVSFPLQTDMKSPDSTAGRQRHCLRANKQDRTNKKQCACDTEHYQTFDGWDDNAILRNILIWTLGCQVQRIFVLSEAGAWRGASAGLLSTSCCISTGESNQILILWLLLLAVCFTKVQTIKLWTK